MSSVANRIHALAAENEIEIVMLASDENLIRGIADHLEIDLEYSGSDDNLLDVLEAEIAELEV